MIGRLEIVAGPDKGKTFPLEDGQLLIIGRGPASNTRLADPYASRVHCEIKCANGGLTLFDRGSSTGTRVNGQPAQERPLMPGDMIELGQTQIVVHLEGLDEDGTMVNPTAKTMRPAPMDAHDLSQLPGTVLEHYEVEKALATGGSSIVFKAKHVTTGNVVALRVLHIELAEQEEVVQRFLRVTRTVLHLRHPHLVTLLEANRYGPYCWMAMEYVDGESLKQVIEKIGMFGILDWRYALRVGRQVSQALEFASQHGILHRNVTPSNILIRQSDSFAKLGDLTLAKALECGADQQITVRGQLLGELAYMSPERAEGDPSIDCRSDLYELGATLYALLTGQAPCTGKNQLEMLSNLKLKVPASPRTVQLSVPEEFERVVMKLLEKKPDNRFQRASELLKALEKVAKDNDVA